MMKKAKEGASLLEVALILLISSLLILGSFHVYQQWMQSAESKDTMIQLRQLLLAGQQYAIFQHQGVTICPVLQLSTSSTLQCGQQWRDQVIIFLDSNDNDQLDADEQVIKQNNLSLSLGRLYWYGLSTKPVIDIEKNTGGFPGYNGRFVYCATDSKYDRELIISRTGQFTEQRSDEKGYCASQ